MPEKRIDIFGTWTRPLWTGKNSESIEEFRVMAIYVYGRGSLHQELSQCAEENPSPRTTKGPMFPQRIAGPRECVQIDFIGPLPHTGNGNQEDLVVVDSFTKWIEAYPVRNCTAAATAKALLEQAFSRFGLPREIDSDQNLILQARSRNIFVKHCRLNSVFT